MQWEALTNLVQSINEREALNLADEQPFNVYYRVSAGERVRSVQAVASCLLYTSPSPRDQRGSRMPSSA